MLRIFPKRQYLICREKPKCQITLLIIIGVHPADAAVIRVFCTTLDCPHKPFVKHSFQQFGILLLLCLYGKGLAEQIVGFLVYHLCVLVVHDLVIRQVLYLLQFPVFSDHGPLPG